MAKNLFVGSLPYSVSEDTLKDLFSQHGQVVSVNIIKDKYSGNSRGFAFVEMGTDEEAQKAMQKLDGSDLEGRNIVVKEALPKPAYPPRDGGRDSFQNKRSGHGRFDRRNRA